MYCRQCGYNNDNYTKICRRCGSSLVDEPDAPKSSAPSAPGELKYAAKSESFKEWLMIPFEKLNRAKPDSTKRKAIYIAIIVVVLAITLNIVINSVRSCNVVVEEDSYGNNGLNILQQAVACTDGEYVYYLVSSGDNTGVFREPVDGGEILKLTYYKLRGLSVYEGWVYGIDPFGIPYRVPCDGGSVQQLYSVAVSDMQIFNHYVYFTTQYSELMRFPIGSIEQGEINPERLGDRYVGSFVIDDAVLYFIEDKSPVKRPVAGKPDVSSSDAPADENDVPSNSDSALAPIPEPEDEPESEKREWRIVNQQTQEDGSISYTVCDYPEVPEGPIWRMAPDGTSPEQLTYDDCSNICVWDGFLYYTTQAVGTVSASDVDHTAPTDLLISRQILQCWKLDLHTLKYVRFLEAGTTASAMLPCEQGFYFLGSEGDMLFYSFADQGISTVLTDVDPVRRLCFAGDWIYFSSYDGLSISRTRSGAVKPENVC